MNWNAILTAFRRAEKWSKVRPGLAGLSLTRFHLPRVGRLTSMPPDVPDRLAYLSPVMAELRRFKYRVRWWLFGMEDPAAGAVVESAVRGRVRGMKGGAARALIADDAEALRCWLEHSAGDPRAQYVYGALSGMVMFADFDELVR